MSTLRGKPPDSPIEPYASVALGCVVALAELHAKGWAHGDVQPAHFIIGPERTHLIDLALARGGHVPEGYNFPFRGCLVHYEAPEIARSVLATGAQLRDRADLQWLSGPGHESGEHTKERGHGHHGDVAMRDVRQLVAVQPT